jgi:AP endonuclease 2
MFTCWETKVNARPGNYGARIDYVVCSHDMKNWFKDSNIQEGLMGSDHCPVFAVTKHKVDVEGEEKHILDVINPPGMFVGGVRKQEWGSKNLLPMSGKLITEFDRRQNIRDMFTRKPTLPKATSSVVEEQDVVISPVKSIAPAPSQSTQATTGSPKPTNGKRKAETPILQAKRTKSSSTAAPIASTKGQQSLKGFFMAKTAPAPVIEPEPTHTPVEAELSDVPAPSPAQTEMSSVPDEIDILSTEAAAEASKSSWGKLFQKPVAPKCEHGEPCKSMLTKKKGENCGRSFWMCARPLGPSGQKERGSQWRCATFIWCSDWDGRSKEGEG